MPYPKKYLYVGRSNDLAGLDRALYRALEILPGALAWATIALVIWFSWKRPIWVAIFIIVFDLYWLIKTIFLSFHLRANWKRMQHNLTIDWNERLTMLKWQSLWQLVVLPTVGESAAIIRESLDTIARSAWPKERMFVVLAMGDAE